MEKLGEALGLPNIGGQIIAFTTSFYSQALRKHEKRVYWRIDIVLPGPNNRYNAAKTSFFSSDWFKLINIFEKTYNKMYFLENQSFSGEYSTIGELCGAKFEVKASNGQISMLFWVSSGTFMFSRLLTSAEVSDSLNLLKSAKQRGENMVEALKELTKD